MTDKDQALDWAIKQEADTALGQLIFDERMKNAVRQRVAMMETLPPVSSRPPLWRRWQPYAWSTLAAAAVTGVVLLNSYRTGSLPQPQAASPVLPAPAAAPQAAPAPSPSAMAMPAAPATELGGSPGGRAPSEPTVSSVRPTMQPMQVQPEPVSVGITPQAGSVIAGQPLGFTIKITSTIENSASLGASTPRLVIKSLGTRNQTTAQVPVPDLGGKQLATRGTQVTTQVVWNSAMAPGYYTVSLEGLTVANGKETISLNPGGQQILVRYPEGEALTRNLTLNKTSSAQDIAMTLQRVEADAQITRVSLRFDGVPGTISNIGLTLQRDGQDVLLPLRTQQEQVPGGIVLSAEFNPLPVTTRSLVLNVTEVQVPGANNIMTTVVGPWRVMVNP